MRVERSAILRVALGVGAGAACLVVAGRLLGVDPWRVARDLAQAPRRGLALCVASAFGVFAAQALRWWLVMRPLLGLRYGQACRAQIVGAMFNVVGLRAGDLLRVQYLGRRTGKSRAAILGTEVVDRWLDFWGWMPVLALLAVFGAVPRWMLATAGVFGALLAGWAAAMTLMTRRGWTPRAGSRLGAVYASFREGVHAFRAPRTWLIAFFVAPLPWLWEALGIWLTTGAFGIAITPGQAFCVLVGFNLAMFVPSPGGVGTVEAGGTAVLVLFGADHAAALAYMFAYHFAQLAAAVVTGMAILLAEGEPLLGRRSRAARS